MFWATAEGVLDFVDVSDTEAEQVLEAIAEVESEQQAASIAGRLRQMGHAL